MAMASRLSTAETRVLKHFDASTRLYVNKELAVYRESVEQRLTMLRDFAGFKNDAHINVLDVGCGAGLFLDLLLESFPDAIATGFDLSPEMLRLNSPSPRKTLSVGDALNMPRNLGEFDVICIDTVMHHLISSTSYSHTIDRISSFLERLRRHLLPGGVVLVREIYHEYLAVASFGSRVIYGISTLQVPAPVERLIKRAGIETANAGVCFLTRAQWQKVFAKSGFCDVAAQDHRWPSQPYRKFGFVASGDIHYLLRPGRPTI